MLKAFPLIQTPILKPAFEQFAPVKQHGLAQRLGLLGVEMLAGDAAYLRKDALQKRDIRPDVGFGAKLNPALRRGNQRIDAVGGRALEIGAELPQGRPQILL